MFQGNCSLCGSDSNRSAARSGAKTGAQIGAAVGSRAGPFGAGLASGFGGAAGFLAGSVVDDLKPDADDGIPLPDGGRPTDGRRQTRGDHPDETDAGVEIPVTEADE